VGAGEDSEVMSGNPQFYHTLNWEQKQSYLK